MIFYTLFGFLKFLPVLFEGIARQENHILGEHDSWENIVIRNSLPSVLVNVIFYQFLKLALDNGLAKIRCNVLSWNKIAISFYKKIGGIVEEDWRQCTFTREVMEKLVNT